MAESWLVFLLGPWCIVVQYDKAHIGPRASVGGERGPAAGVAAGTDASVGKAAAAGVDVTVAWAYVRPLGWPEVFGAMTSCPAMGYALSPLAVACLRSCLDLNCS